MCLKKEMDENIKMYRLTQVKRYDYCLYIHMLQDLTV